MDMSEAPWYQLVLDFNHDTLITISDFTSLIPAVFYLPVDSTLYYIFKNDTFMTFFEVSRTYDHGFWSTIFTVVFWLEAIWYTFIAVMIALGPLLREPKGTAGIAQPPSERGEWP